MSSCSDFPSEQCQDPDLKAVIKFLEEDRLPEDSVHAKKLATQEPLFSIIDGVLYYIDRWHDHQKRAAVPLHLRKRLLWEAHGGSHGGYFSGRKLIVRKWWWRRMYADVLAYCKQCPDCTVVTGGGCPH